MLCMEKSIKTFFAPGKENKLNVCTVFATLAGLALRKGNNTRYLS